MKEIKLTKGKFAQVDDEDYEYLNQFKWAVTQKGNNFYARTYIREYNKCKGIYMHRMIMKSLKGNITDHRDRNGLNNQKSNLRLSTYAQNNCNKMGYGNSKYLGVHIDKKGSIRSEIGFNKKVFYLGAFKTEELAARAYDKKAKELYGEFANLNFSVNF